MSNVAAAAFAPFISAAGASMFGFDNWPELARPRDLAKIFETQEYTKWRSFRDSEDSRFVSLVMPRTLARLPYGEATKAIDEFNYEEAPYDEAGAAKPMQHNEYCWMNAAYAMGTKLTDAFAKYGFCTAIRGAEGGGKVENLPYHVFTSDDGDQDAKCPTEIAITDRREFELSNLGSCRSATTRTPTTRCSSARRRCRSRRSTIVRRRPRTRRSRRACPTSWRPAASLTT